MEALRAVGKAKQDLVDLKTREGDFKDAKKKVEELSIKMVSLCENGREMVTTSTARAASIEARRSTGKGARKSRDSDGGDKSAPPPSKRARRSK